MIGINHIPRCYGNLVAMATRVKKTNYSFVLSCIEFIFGMELAWDNRHQPHTYIPHTYIHGNSVTMATRVKHQ